jgi:hypothetical protein
MPGGVDPAAAQKIGARSGLQVPSHVRAPKHRKL